MKLKTITQKHLTDYEASLRSDEKSGRTIEKYLRDLRYFAVFCDGREVTKALILEYKASLEQRFARSSANSMLAALNGFLKFSGRSELCVKQFKIQRKTYCSEERELSKRDYISLVRTAEQGHNQRLSLLLQTICATGIRVSELLHITVEAAKHGEAVVSSKGKTRVVFLVPELCRKLLRYARAHKITTGAIFVTKHGALMDRSNIWREMKQLCLRAGVSPKKVFPHNLRHLFARTFYSLERDIAKLADILGHVSIDTTRIYIISTGAEHRKKLQRMHLIL